ncbi:MAG: low affinity iron permease family protein [Alphaproteobacteria bacterium]|nr:low affinity iron permease family protein [Alphaproteobacteria bacterium]
MKASPENANFLEKLSHHSARHAGGPWAFVVAVAFVLAWVLAGPFVHYSHYWELIMIYGSNVVTFVMVFLIQRVQNKESAAMQIKLNEIIAALNGANNKMISIENLSEGEIVLLEKDYQDLATQINKEDETSTCAVSVDDIIKDDVVT